MKNLQKLIVLIGFNIFIYNQGYTQIASDTVGCVPLLVQFTSPDTSLKHTFWDFDDGASSDLLNPSHVFVSAGTFFVTLKNKDSLVSTIKISIYPALNPQITVDTNQGCAPLSIQFKSIMDLPDPIKITGYFWDFGDGAGTSDENPLHTFNDVDNFDVTLTVYTNIAECNIIKTFKDVVMIREKQQISFEVDSLLPKCEFPTFLHVKYTGINDAGYSYDWNFGNGETSTKAQPDPVQYNNEGAYNITLEVDNNKGCKSKLTIPKSLIFYPTISVTMNEKVCVNKKLFIKNNTTNSEKFLWNFGSSGKPSTSDSKIPPDVHFTSEGEQNIYLKVTSKYGCEKDTTFKIMVGNADASFTMDPPFGCSLPLEIKFNANDTTNTYYQWNGIPGGPTSTRFLEDVIRDTFYYNLVDSLKINLIVTSADGCGAHSSQTFYNQLPNAQFELNKFEGEAPFLLVVEDKSESNYPIVKWTFNWGDESTSEYNPTTIWSASHLYTEPGKYYVNLSIVNERGCVDNHYGAWIEVHEPPVFSGLPTCEGGGSGGGGFGNGILCYKDTFTLIVMNVPPQFDAFQFIMGNTVSHCEDLKTVKIPAFDDPGIHTVGVTLDNGGKFYDYNPLIDIQIHGAKSKIKYQVNCDDNYNVYFENQSINATEFHWVIEGDTITENSFYYRFSGRGNYQVMLIANNETEACKPDTSEVTIRLRDVKAAIDTEYNWCEDVRTLLSASPSEDEIVGCGMGYLWRFPKYLNKANIITDQEEVYVALPAGEHRISLEVRDVNGCRDTTYYDVKVNHIKADFEMDRVAVCDSVQIKLNDISVHDNPIVNYKWNVSPEENAPAISYIFNSKGNIEFRVSLLVTDSLGCDSRIEKIYPVYKPFTIIGYDSIMCKSNPGVIHATDFKLYDSYLNYFWKIDEISVPGNNTLQLPVLDAGIHQIKLKINEEGTMCDNHYAFTIKVLEDPLASFTGLEDSVYCYPKTFLLNGSSSIIDPDDVVIYSWSFDNNRTSQRINPVTTFGKGNYRVSFSIKSIYGCENTVSKNISLVGPEGKLTADKSVICKGDVIQFSVFDNVEVTSFYWDFGQGSTAFNESSATYKYDFVPPNGKTFASVVLQSATTGCEIVLTLPIEIHKVDAVFKPDTTCDDSIQIMNLSQGADINNWTSNGKKLSVEYSPWINLGAPGTYPIRLTIKNETYGCIDSTENFITFLERPAINSEPVINLCSNQQYSFLFDTAHKVNFSPPGLAVQNGEFITITAGSSALLEMKAVATNGCETTKNLIIKHSEYNNTDTFFNYIVCGDFSTIPLILNLSTGDSVVWSLDGFNLPDGVLSCQDCNEPKIIGHIDGNLIAKIYNENSCLQRTMVNEIEYADIQIPNVFSPNGDNNNDLFRPVMTGMVSDTLLIEQLQIFNRWGKQVYSSDKAWDGMINNFPAATEVYYFNVRYKIGKYCNRALRGDVTLIR
ncbi:MAG: gliding motility-associated C-terminal domain-containing protein [Saprospiraceae bacterium]|nr:gliding motility-associated C-terminal domain-containing protein [Saprospiraceae bacterium]